PEGPWADFGTTPAGTPVRVHPVLAEARAIAAFGSVSFHYFAGFGGGWKLPFPGLGERSSIAGNHRRALAEDPGGGLATGVLPGGPGVDELRALARGAGPRGASGRGSDALPNACADRSVAGRARRTLPCRLGGPGAPGCARPLGRDLHP